MKLHKFSDYEVGRPYAYAATQTVVSGTGAAANPHDVARRAAPVILMFLQANYPNVLDPSVEPSMFDPRLLVVTGKRLAEVFSFPVPQTVLAAGYSPTLTFVGDQVDAFLREINRRHYAAASPAEVSYAPLETPAPRSPICPCGIDRRDCEYHA